MDEALPVVNRINSPSLGIAVNLSQERMGGKDSVLANTFAIAKNRIAAILISGQLEIIDMSSTSKKLVGTIRSLDDSPYDLKPFMELIKTSGFNGPIGFLNFKLSNPSDYLARTKQRWDELCMEVGLYKVIDN